MEDVSNLRVLLEPADKQILTAVAKARGTNAAQTVRDLIHCFYEGMLKKLDPETAELLERGTLDRRAYGRARLKYQQKRKADVSQPVAS